MVSITTKYVLKIFLGMLILPLYFLIKIIPRDKNLWIFGSWDGKKANDNSYYFYKFIKQNHKKINCIWFAKDKNVVALCREKEIPCLYSYSIKGILTSLRAGVWIYTHSCDGDINYFTWPGSIRVFIGHTIPFKRMYFDDNVYSEINKKLYRVGRFLSPLFFITGNDSIIVVNSDLEKKIFENAFLAKDNIFVLGYPRNDQLFVETISRQKKDKKLKALYAPTFRNNSKWKSLVSDNGFWGVLDECALKNNLILDVKIHNSDLNSINTSNLKLKNIKFLSSSDITSDINSILPYYDILISDYSGVTFDFLILKRPIILFAPDLKEYLQERGVYESSLRLHNLNSAKNIEQLCQLIEISVKNPEKLTDLYAKYSDEYHSFKDGKNSERIYDKITKLLT